MLTRCWGWRASRALTAVPRAASRQSMRRLTLSPLSATSLLVRSLTTTSSAVLRTAATPTPTPPTAAPGGKAELSVKERRHLKAQRENHKRFAQPKSGQPSQPSPTSVFSFGAAPLSGASTMPGAGGGSGGGGSGTVTSGLSVPSLFGETAGTVAFQSYRPNKYRALCGVGVTSILIWSLIGATTEALAAVSAPTFWQNPAWTLLGLGASIVYLWQVRGSAHRSVAELIFLSSGTTRVRTHGVLWGTNLIEVAPQSISMAPLSADSLTGSELQFRVAGYRPLTLDRRYGTLGSAWAMRRIFQWDGNPNAPGGGGDPARIDAFTEKVFTPPTADTIAALAAKAQAEASAPKPTTQHRHSA